jgi:hypothetical protein
LELVASRSNSSKKLAEPPRISAGSVSVNSPTRLAAVRHELDAVPYAMDRGELVVDKRYEPIADTVIDSIVPDRSSAP